MKHKEITAILMIGLMFGSAVHFASAHEAEYSRDGGTTGSSYRTSIENGSEDSGHAGTGTNDSEGAASGLPGNGSHDDHESPGPATDGSSHHDDAAALNETGHHDNENEINETDGINGNTGGMNDTNSTNDGGTNQTAQAYAWSEVQSHNQSADCWVVLFGKAYDITPQESQGFTIPCGTDQTPLYQSMYGSNVTMMDPYYKGIVTGPPVQPPAPALSINPISPKAVTAGDTVSFTAASAGGAAPISYSLSGAVPGGASIDPSTGTFSWTTTAEGTYAFAVVATDSASPAATVSTDVTITVAAVQPVPVLTAIALSPSSPALAAGSTRQLTAAALDQFSNPITATVTWSSNNTAVATVNPSTGLVTAVAQGSARITAASGSVHGYAYVTVNPPATPTYTLAQVQSHNTASSCWTVLFGQVYDITPLLSTHSGGSSMFVCGSDLSTTYQSIHGTNVARMSSYFIGTLA